MKSWPPLGASFFEALNLVSTSDPLQPSTGAYHLFDSSLQAHFSSYS